MVKGYVLNNTGRSKHIYKRTVYPGQRLDLEYVYKVIGGQVPDGTSFVEWLEKELPSGWEVNVLKVEKADNLDETGGRPYKETLTAQPEVHSCSEKKENSQEHLKEVKRTYATPRAIDKMTAREIYNLKLKDNPKRILSHITSVHKLRRALSMCKDDNRKNTLSRLIQRRIRELNLTL
jgi:hypothetical protein